MKNTIKIIAIDMDGTLLDQQKRLLQWNADVLRRCLEAGVHIVPATGRTWEGVPDEVRALPGLRYAITTNGAIVLDAKEDKVIRECKLTNPLALELMELAASCHIMYDFYLNGRGYTEPRFIEQMEHLDLPQEFQELIRRTRTVVPELRDFLRDSGHSVEKINYVFHDMQLRREARVMLAERSDVVVSSSMENNLELNALGATKGDGLRVLADHLGIDPSQTMAFGDGENDVSMIRQAGIGVVMGNGNEELKKIANYVTSSNEECGVAAAIEKFLFPN